MVNRTITLALTETELHGVCNAADLWAFIAEKRLNDDRWKGISDTTEKMREQWFAQVTGGS